MSIKTLQLTGILILIPFFGGVMLQETQAQPNKEELLEQASEYFSQSQESEALKAYLDVLKVDGDNFEALWHISLLHARIGYRAESKAQMREYYEESLKYAEEVLQKYPEEGRSHFVYAVANGRISDISGSKVRIEKSHVVKRHIDKALEMMPEFGPAWHLLGLWHSKVANVGSAQKFAAGMFSKGLPKGASNAKAAQYIRKAIDLEPSQTLRFKLDLAQHYQRAGEDQKAISVLNEVLKMNAETEIDQWNLERARDLLDDLM